MNKTFQPFTGNEDSTRIEKRWNFADAVIHSNKNDGSRKYQVVFEFDSVTIEDVIYRIWQMMAGEECIEPKYIVLENGLRIPFIGVLANYFESKGRISFLEYLTESLKAEEGEVSHG